MPKRPAKDGSHTVFTDHRIARFPSRGDQRPSDDIGIKLRAWHEPTGVLAIRNLGLANMAIGERERSTELMDKGAEQLTEAMKELPPDPVLLTKLGIALLKKGFSSDAIEFLKYALTLQPDDAGSHANLGMAYKESGESDRAIEELGKAIDLDPALQSAYQMLGEIYLKQNNLVELRHTLEKYLKAMPNNLTAIKALEELNAKSYSR